MAGMGRYPKDDLSRRNRNERNFDWTTLPPEGRPGPAPRLPDLRPWTPATLAWWEKLWATPQATMWDQSGRTLHTLAILHHHLMVDSEGVRAATIAAEMRQHEDRHGLTPKAMLQLRWRVGRTFQDGTGKVLHLVPREVADRVAEGRLDPSRVPPKRAAKSEWIEWAVELGWERSTAEKLSKAQLVEHCSSVPLPASSEASPASSSSAVGRLREASAKASARTPRKRSSAKASAKPKGKGRS